MRKNRIPRILRAAQPKRAWLVVILCAGLFFSGVVNNWGSSNVANLAMAQSDGGVKPVFRLVTDARNAGEKFPVHELFEGQVQSIADSASAQQAVQNGTILNLREEALPAILSDEVSTLTLPMPSAIGSSVELELVRVDILTPDFAVFTSTSSGLPVPVETGAHYRGVVKDEPNSLASVSVFRDEVMALYSTQQEGNFVLGKLAGKEADGDHILYAEKDLKEPMPFTCDTKDDGHPYTADELQEPAAIVARCVRIYVEANFDVFQNRGSNIVNVVSFVAGFFNQSATIYANEAIPISLSELFIWTSPSPYTGTDNQTLLGQFQAFRNSFDGDLGHLVNLGGENVGGRAAGFSGFCNANIDARQCFSAISNFFNNVPTYSWTVFVFTHEMGHLMGSRHTHACVWNGNNTAIDGCSGFTEEGCPLPGIPSDGGTIMSYCFRPPGVGINFTKGFGPQPGNVIRNGYNAAGCLISCRSTPINFARLYINLANNTFFDSTGGAASFVNSPSGGRTVVRITLNPSVNGFSRARFTVAYNSTPSAWTVNIGDSSTNNGGGGDAVTQSNDAEIQVLNTTMTALGRDATPPPKKLIDVPSFVASGRTVIFEVSNNFLGWSSLNTSGTLSSIYLYALNGQPDTEGPVNYDIYAAFNRVIYDPSAQRTGSGVGFVTVDLLP